MRKGGYLPLIHGLLKEATAMGKDSSPRSGLYGSDPGGKIPPVQVRGSQEGLGVYKFFGEEGESWQGLNLPLEESNLAKMTEAEVSRKFGSLPVKVAQFKEGGAGDLRGGRKEAWPYLLGFLLTILAVEMGGCGKDIKNRIAPSVTTS